MSTALDMRIESPSSAQTCGQLTGPISGPMSPAPVFVVGMWRSGTSLLYALLNQHPQIGLMYESDFSLLSPLFVLPRKSSSWLTESRLLERSVDPPQDRLLRDSRKHHRLAGRVSCGRAAIRGQKRRDGLGMQVAQLLRLHDPVGGLVSAGEVHRDLARSGGRLPQHCAGSAEIFLVRAAGDGLTRSARLLPHEARGRRVGAARRGYSPVQYDDLVREPGRGFDRDLRIYRHAVRSYACRLSKARTAPRFTTVITIRWSRVQKS